MTSEQREVSISEVEGPKGTAEILEVTNTRGGVIEVEYIVVFEGQRRGAPSMGEAHILADELVGLHQGA